MAKITIPNQTGPTTPSSGYSALFVDSTTKKLFTKDDAGRYWGAPLRNYSIANDPSAFASDLYVVGSNVQIPSFGTQAGSRYFSRLSMSGTPGSTAQPVITMRIGASGIVSDSTITWTITTPAQTAVADKAILNILVLTRVVSASVGVFQSVAWFEHQGTAANTTTSGTGYTNNTTGQTDQGSGNKDNSAIGGLYMGYSMNFGASSAITVTMVDSQLDV